MINQKTDKNMDRNNHSLSFLILSSVLFMFRHMKDDDLSVYCLYFFCYSMIEVCDISVPSNQINKQKWKVSKKGKN
jgi:hypothetical protein